MMGENESEVSGSNKEVAHQCRLLNITIKTEADVDETPCGSHSEDMSTDSELLHANPSHLQETQRAESTLPTVVEINSFQVKKEETDDYEEYHLKPLEDNVSKSPAEDRRMDAESCDAESREGESEEDTSESEKTDDSDDDDDAEGAQAAQNKAPIQQKYRCKVCGRSFGFKALLIKHVKEEERDADECGVCGKHFESKESLMLHLQTYIPKNDCELCLRRFDSLKDLEVHIRRHTGEKAHICGECGRGFTQKLALKGHMISHRKMMRMLYICSVCGQGFKPTASSKQYPMLCEVCSEHLDSDESFRIHLEVNRKGNTYWDQTGAERKAGDVDDSKRETDGADGETKSLSKRGTEKYYCKVCGMSFCMRASFWKHVMENEKDTDICGVCGKRFDSDESLRLHLQAYMPVKSCKVCGLKFDCLYRMEIHKRTHTGEKPYICMCGKAFAIKKGLKRHMQIHTREKMYDCLMCGQSFRHILGFKHRPALCGDCGGNPDTGESLGAPAKIENEEDTGEEQTGNTDAGICDAESEARNGDEGERESEPSESGAQGSHKHKEQQYSCKVCGKVFCRISYFLKHVMEIEKDTDMCGVCGEHFESHEILKVHLQTHIPIKECKVCGKEFRSPALLDAHKITHTGKRSYICSECGKAFSGNSILLSHMRSHTGEKPFACEVCNQGFRSKPCLRSHMRTHTGERPFPCSVCGKRFRQSGVLNIHMRLHTREFKHGCIVCGKKFNTSSALKAHMRTHTGERPYPCSVCEKRFRRSSALKMHMRTHTRRQHKGGETTAAGSVTKTQ
ncbi:zinc finger protein 709-like isoform X2 [Notolabrus celidotus]|uniref:zinc finger protein 709-like isoform X2 n=1 Tax=Notolabrus celidotus TaxID=1203425 RepID=UPI0014903747|nr:zinc finger protein 709-like isoform X2 [Notolabrus celidotus]